MKKTDITALRARQAKLDAYHSNRAQAAARDYLQRKGQPQSTGLIREMIAGVLFITAMVAMLIIGLAL